MPTYVKKPVEVEAIQFDGSADSAHTVLEFVHPGRPVSDYTRVWADRKDDRPESEWWVWIRTLEGVMEAAPGDWIIKGVKGEFYPCKPEVFDLTYEPLARATTSATAKALEDATTPVDDPRQSEIENNDGLGI